MKLIIREYLSMLKEDGEVDALLTDLVVSMNLTPLSNIEKGRQFGADLVAVGIDNDDDVQKVFFFIIKRGNITRSVWDSGENAVRQSINEVLDLGKKILIDSDYKDLTKKIVVCTNGDLSQNLLSSWNSFKDNFLYKNENMQLEFWGADKLSLLVENYLFDEYSIVNNEFAKKAIRKTLAFLDLNDYEPKEFYKLIDYILFDQDLKKESDILKALKLLNLCLNLIFHWSREINNLKPAYLSSERLYLKAWEFLSKKDLYKNKRVNSDFNSINDTHLKIMSEYFKKIESHCYIKDALNISSGLGGFEYQLMVFDQIGILSTIGLFYFFMAMNSSNKEVEKLSLNNSLVVSDALEALIINHAPSYTPLYDEHIIDITLGLLLFYYTQKEKSIDSWFHNIFQRLFTGYQCFNMFPLFSDNYEELVDISFGFKEVKVESSTLLYILLELLVCLDKKDMYDSVFNATTNLLPNIDFQLWYPEEDIEEKLYSQNCLTNSGSMEVHIRPDKDFNTFKNNILNALELFENPKKLTFLKYGMRIIGLMASRHYRTPIFPFYWRNLSSF